MSTAHGARVRCQFANAGISCAHYESPVWRRKTLLARPVAQRGLGLVPLQRTPVQPQLLEELPRGTDLRARRQAQQLHDLVAVEVRAHAGEVLLGRDARD